MDDGAGGIATGNLGDELWVSMWAGGICLPGRGGEDRMCLPVAMGLQPCLRLREAIVEGNLPHGIEPSVGIISQAVDFGARPGYNAGRWIRTGLRT